MSGYYNESDPYDDDNGRQGGSGGGLRKQLEEALAKVQRLEGRLEERNQRSVPDLLKDKGIDPALAEIVPKENPQEWVEKYAHLLSAKPPKVNLEDTEVSEPNISSPDPAEEDPAITAERSARAAQEESRDNGTPPVISNDLLERMNAISSEDELIRFFNANGMPGSQ